MGKSAANIHENKLGSKIVKYLLIALSLVFVFLMLVLPLFIVIKEALRDGWETYKKAVTDN